MEILQFPAKSGDAVLIKSDDSFLLVDGGYTITYYDFIKPFLQENKINLDWVICSHFDQDHIGGLIPLMQDYETVGNIWFNGFFSLFPESDNVVELSSIERMQLRQEFSYVSTFDTDGGDIGRKQGEHLSLLLKDRANCIINSGLKTINSNLSWHSVSSETKILVISPATSALDELKKKWEKELSNAIERRNPKVDRDVVEAFEKYLLASRSSTDASSEFEDISFHQANLNDFQNIKAPSNDNSIANKTSISFIIQNAQKSLLYCSDTDDQTLYDFLSKSNFSRFDGIKLSHHGSLRNNWKWLDIVKSDNFFISTDGEKHQDHPSMSVLVKIAKNNPGCNIHFNYTIPKVVLFYKRFEKELECKFVFHDDKELNFVQL